MISSICKMNGAMKSYTNNYQFTSNMLWDETKRYVNRIHNVHKI